MNRGVGALLPVIALAVGFAAGTGFGVVVLGDGGGLDEEVAPEVSREGSTRADRSVGEEPSSDSAPRSAPGGERTTRRRGVSTDDVMVENAMRGSLDIPTSGSGLISGTVSDENGQPLAGVVVSARTDVNSIQNDEKQTGQATAETAAEPVDSLDSRIRAAIRSFRFEEATRREATTGADGTYRLENMIDARFTLTLEKTGYTFRTASGAEWQASPGEVRDWIGAPVSAIEVVATLPDGSTAPEYHLIWQSLADNSSGQTQQTKGSDPLELAPGEYEFTVSAGEHHRHRSEATQVQVLEGQPTRVEVALLARPGIMGTVTFSGEKPTMAGVSALRVGDSVEAVPDNLLQSTTIHWAQDPFEYALLDLPPGSYLVGVLLRNGKLLDSRMVDVGEALSEEHFPIGDVDVRDYTVVRVRGPDGQAVREVMFSVGYQAGDTSFDGNVAANRQPDGSFRVPHVLPGSPEVGFNGWSRSGEVAPNMDLSGLKTFVTVSSPRFGQKRVEFDPLTQRELDIEFGEPGFAQVTVAGYAESEWRGRVQSTLRAVPDPSAPQRMHINVQQQSMSSQGVARVGPVEPGTYVVVLLVNTPQNGMREVATQELSMGVGDNPVTMSIPDLHELTMECRGVSLDLDLHRDPALGQTTDFLDEGVREGLLTHFRAIVAGRYRVRAYGEGSPGEMMVDVPAAGAIVFEPTAYDALRVDHVPEAAEGVLRQGDVILAVADHPMEGDRQIRAALALAKTAESVSLTVRRNGGTIELSVPGAALDYGPLTNWTR